MAPLVHWLFVVTVLIGHISIAVWLFNRLHATALPWRVVKGLEKILMLTAALVLLALVMQAAVLGGNLLATRSMWLGYVVLCLLAAITTIPIWLVPKLLESLPSVLVSNDTTCVDVAKRLKFRPLDGARARIWGHFPGNELLRISVQKKTLHLPGLPEELDGLSIAHLSDLHMTGQFSREFYDVIVDETNALNADLVVITGDILEKRGCLPWIEPTLGRLKARYGKFFVLGNHELRLGDVAPLRKALTDMGLIDLGGQYKELDVRGVKLLIAGNELPWFGQAPVIPESAMRNRQYRILLSHSPDQLPWAKANQFDLMLAGHNHGGQIRLPYLGALITPSRYGCRYAGGLYHEPPTLLHVSRGLAGTHMIRLNCPPELPLLTLKSQSTG
jgi:uncharacterized protein